jgi:hypothetical protein
MAPLNNPQLGYMFTFVISTIASQHNIVFLMSNFLFKRVDLLFALVAVILSMHQMTTKGLVSVTVLHNLCSLYAFLLDVVRISLGLHQK